MDVSYYLDIGTTTLREFIFTTRRYANAVYDVIVCLFVRLSVCHKSIRVLQRRLNLGSHKKCRTIAQGL